VEVLAPLDLISAKKSCFIVSKRKKQYFTTSGPPTKIFERPSSGPLEIILETPMVKVSFWVIPCQVTQWAKPYLLEFNEI